MKRIFLISISLALIGMGAYYAWKYYHPKPTYAWDLVPADALAVYEHNKNANATTLLLTQQFLSDSIAKVPLPKDFLISFHRIAKDVAGSIFYLAGTPTEKITSQLRAKKGTKARVFEGIQIMEIPIAKSKHLSGIVVDEVLVLSSSPLLIEDVIRTSKAEEPKNFFLEHRSLFKFPKMDWNDGRFYINLEKLPAILDLFVRDSGPLSFISNFAGSSLADIKIEKDILALSGFAKDSITNGASILSMFNHQRPVPVTLPKIISSRCGWLMHYGVSDPTTWAADHEVFMRSHPKADSLTDLKEKYGFDSDVFYAGLGNEWGNCHGGIFEGDIFILKLANNKSETELLKLKSDQPTEPYSHYEIRSLTQESLPTKLFWPLCTETMNYWAVIDRHLVFAKVQEDIKAFIDDVDTDNTWGKSSEWNKFLSSTQETNMGLIFDGINAWPSWKKQLNPKWQSKGDSTHLYGLDRGSLQIIRLENTYSLNGTFQLEPGISKNNTAQKEKFIELELTKPLVLPLTTVKNHNNGADELIGQDSDDNLILFSSGLRKLFSTQLDGKIKTSIFQIDLYKNKKLQYLFATDNSIYLIDRLGNKVKGFPFPIPGTKPIQFLSAVDQTNSRNYSLLVTDTDGNIGLFGMGGQKLDNWNPPQVSDLLAAPRFTRMDGRDYVIALSKDGKLHGFSGTGAVAPGFPVQLKVRPSGNWTLDKNNGVTNLVIVSEDGVLIRVDAKGNVISRTNLIKSSASSRFKLVQAPNADHFAIGRVDRSKLSAMNGTGDLLFELDNPGSEDMYFTYFEVDQNKKVFAFTDPQQEFTYFFNSRGEPIFSRPLENQQSPAIASEKGTVYFYSVLPSKIQSLKRTRIR